jgi:hypothetical protein
MKRLLVFALVVAASALAVPAPAHASWVSDHCFDDHNDDPIFKRADARAYADIADEEGYEYGGGCWNNNNVDDTPGQPDSNGEGPDCSGLVFKSWELKPTSGASGGTWWNKFENIHGPYSSYRYHDALASDPFHNLPNKQRITTVYMDAFARDGHVGLLETNAGTSKGTDLINEAKGDAWGTGVFEEDWRTDSAYVGVRREGWAADCSPQCTRRQTSAVVRVP